MLILNITLDCVSEPSKALVPVGYTNHSSPAPVWCIGTVVGKISLHLCKCAYMFV